VARNVRFFSVSFDFVWRAGDDDDDDDIMSALSFYLFFWLRCNT